MFEVILYSTTKSWAYSTYEKAQTMHEALQKADRYFSDHLMRRNFNWGSQTAYAYVIAKSGASWFTKHSGRWEPAELPLEMPVPPPVGASGKHTLALVL